MGLRRIRVVAVCGSVALVLGATVNAQIPQQDLASFVNPFVGTTNGGNTYPGATLPFGMVAFSPEEESEEHPCVFPLQAVICGKQHASAASVSRIFRGPAARQAAMSRSCL